VQRELLVSTDPAAEAARLIVGTQPRTWALAGGSTPRGLYERLVNADLPWPEIECFFGDERCVPPDHPASNYRMAREALLDRVPTSVHRMPGETCDAEAYERVLHDRLGDRPRLDLVLLGLGDDGHTASLFPGDAALEERTRLVARVERPDFSRLTMTLPLLSAARIALFLVVGDSKREALAQLLADADIPASRVAADRVIVVADHAAAGDAARA
jgi:6-phosphogluconolactonase